MAIKIIWSDKAEFDLQEIFSYWNNRNKSKRYSQKLNLLINSSIEYLYDFPTMGRKTIVNGVRYLAIAF